MDSLFLVIGLIFTLGLIILFVRLVYLLFVPSFYRFYSRVGRKKIQSLLAEKGFEFVNGREVLNRKAESLGHKKNFLEKISFRVIHFQFVEGFNIEDGSTQYFWIKGSRLVWFYYLFPVRVEIFSESDKQIVKELKTWAFNDQPKIKLIIDTCPACQAEVKKSYRKCPDCGLVFQ